MAASGVRSDFSRLDRLIEELPEAQKKASLAMVQGAGEESQQIVPYDTGRLARSMQIRQRSDGRAALVYTEPYAASVHENNFNYGRGRWQYVREPIVRAAARLQDAANALKEAFPMIHELETTTIPIPHEPGEWIEARTDLAPATAARAREAAEVAATMKVTAAYLKVGREGIHAIQEMHAQGMSAEQITERMNAGADPDAAPADVIQPAGGAEDETPGQPEKEETPANVIQPAGGAEDETPGQPEKEETPANGVPTDEQLREAYDLDIAANLWIICWSYKFPGTEKPVPPTVDMIRKLDAKTRRWIHDRVWPLIRTAAEEDLAGK